MEPGGAEGRSQYWRFRLPHCHTRHVGDSIRFGELDDPDGLPVRIFSPDDHGTPHFIAVDGSTARTPDERRLLVAAANIVLATLWKWQLDDSPFAMNDYLATLTIALADNNQRNQASTDLEAWPGKAGVAGLMQFNRDWLAIDEFAEFSRNDAVLSWSNRLADAAVHELHHWVDGVSRITESGLGALTDAAVENLMDRFLDDLGALVPAGVRSRQLESLARRRREWDVSAAHQVAHVLIETVASTNAFLRTHGSLSYIARCPSLKFDAMLPTGTLHAAEVRTIAEFGAQFPANATNRNKEIWAIVGTITDQLPGYFPTTEQFLRSEIEERMLHAPWNASGETGLVAYPPVRARDTFEGPAITICSYNSGPRSEPPPSPWGVPTGDRAFGTDLDFGQSL
jgi:hypothetical protein